MAQFTFTNNTYAGEALAGFMASTLLEADSVKRGLLTVINDVKSRKILLDVDDDIVLQNPSAIFNDQATTAQQTESYLDPVVYEFMKQEQWDKLVQSWESQSIKPGAFADYEGVVDLSDFLVQRYLTKLQIANERLYWLGKSNVLEATFTAAFPGLLPKIKSNSGTYKVSLAGTPDASMSVTSIDATGLVTVADTAGLIAGDIITFTDVTGSIVDSLYGSLVGQSYSINAVTATTFKLQRNYNEVNKRRNAAFTGTATGAAFSYINASNVVKVLGSVYAQIDYADRVQPDFKILIPLHVSLAYKEAQAAKALNVLGAFTQDKQLEYLGIPLEPMNHFTANAILGARTSNLFLGVDLLSDVSELSTVYMKPYTNDNVVRMKARMKAATEVKFYNEVFYLGA